MDAVVKGTMQGLELLFSIVAMIIVLLALVFLVNAILGILPDVGGAALSLERIMGWVMAPVVWAIGIPWAEAAQGGSLIGQKLVLNEFVAYGEYRGLKEAMSDKTQAIVAVALCGFANFSSIAILLGGLGGMAPTRRSEIARLGLIRGGAQCSSTSRPKTPIWPGRSRRGTRRPSRITTTSTSSRPVAPLAALRRSSSERVSCPS